MSARRRFKAIRCMSPTKAGVAHPPRLVWLIRGPEAGRWRAIHCALNTWRGGSSENRTRILVNIGDRAS